MEFLRQTWAALGLFGCLALAACGTLSNTGVEQIDAAAARPLHADNLRAEVDALAGPLVEGGQTPGLLVGVLLPDGSTRFFGYGVADQASRQPPDGDTLFPIGSLSKGFLAGVAATLVDEGALAWSDTLADLLPPGTRLSPDAARITLLQLAAHTSGLPRQPVTPRALWYFLGYLFHGGSFYKDFDRDYIYAYLAGFRADTSGEPQYSNIGYGLLGHVLELRTGRTVDALLAERIAGPLHLACTGYGGGAPPCGALRAHGYAGDQPKFIRRGHPTPDWDFTHFMRGSAAMESTGRDLLRYAAAHLRAGQGRLNTVLASTMRVQLSRPEKAAAIAWQVDDVLGEPVTYQIGLVAGFTSYIGVDTEHRTAVVVLQNSFNWDNSIGHRLLVHLRSMDLPRLMAARG